MTNSSFIFIQKRDNIDLQPNNPMYMTIEVPSFKSAIKWSTELNYQPKLEMSWIFIKHHLASEIVEPSQYKGMKLVDFITTYYPERLI